MQFLGSQPPQPLGRFSPGSPGLGPTPCASDRNLCPDPLPPSFTWIWEATSILNFEFFWMKSHGVKLNVMMFPLCFALRLPVCCVWLLIKTSHDAGISP